LRRAWNPLAVARILIVGGGCPGRSLGAELVHGGHAVRVSTRGEHGREAIERTGAECWIGAPDRLATLRGALDGVTLACWLLGRARGEVGELRELHAARLQAFMRLVVDTTVRGVVYDARSATIAPEILAAGAQIVQAAAELNSIPAAVLRADPADEDAWLAGARRAVGSLLGE
jgi:hypothetical protein